MEAVSSSECLIGKFLAEESLSVSFHHLMRLAIIEIMIIIVIIVIIFL